jgi:hypothetical protein
MVDGVFVDGRLGPRRAGMRPAGGFATVVGRRFSRGRVGLGAKALIAAGEFELQLGHLGLEFGVFRAKNGILGAERSHFGPQCFDQSQQFVHDRQTLTDRPPST